jgi:cobalt/nickel transport system permease protein
MDARSVPLIALVAAFSFVVMMFNVPLPGGTTAHAVGASLAAILLGPETATIAVSIALIIQAIFFGDGGILALGANSFNMAVVVPYMAAALYRLLSRGTPLSSPRRLVGAALGGWFGLTMAAMFAGIEFGLQPLLFRSADGSPLYAPYPLAIAIPAMVIPHALTASLVEGLLTALILGYLQRSNPALLEAGEGTFRSASVGGWQSLRWLWIGLLVLVLASPLGLLAPGTAWGEWGTQQLRARGLATIPAGLQQLSGLWGAPLAGYRLRSLGNASLGYILSAALGILVIAVVAWLFSLLVTKAPDLPDHTK